MASPLNTCKQQVNELLTRTDLYQPKESTHHLHTIGNLVDHVNLDRTFLMGSHEWRSHHDPSKLKQFASGATGAAEHANSTMRGVKGGLTVEAARTMPDNIMRQHAATTTEALHTARDNLYPYAKESRDRIQQFSDLLGVTDRYTGYRHNMSRNRQTFKLDTDWARKSMPEAKSVYFASELVPQRSNARFNLESARGGEQSHSAHADAHQHSPKQLQSRDRTIENRDWRTDYMVGFAPKVRPPYGKPFPLNPDQDFTKMTRGRPMAVQMYDKRTTEYADRYISPRNQLDTHRLPKFHA